MKGPEFKPQNSHQKKKKKKKKKTSSFLTYSPGVFQVYKITLLPNDDSISSWPIFLSLTYFMFWYMNQNFHNNMEVYILVSS
jgi:hypothetical protein